MFLALLAFGSWLFWGVLALLALVLICLYDEEKFARITLVFVAAVAVILAVTSGLPSINITLGQGAMLFVGYFVAGTIWAVFKWRFSFLPPIFEKMRGAKEKFMKDLGLTDINQLVTREQLEAAKISNQRLDDLGLPYTQSHAYDKKYDFKSYEEITGSQMFAIMYRKDIVGFKELTAAGTNKARITGWIGWFPLSIINFAIGEMLQRIVSEIYENIRGIFDKISYSMSKKYDLTFD